MHILYLADAVLADLAGGSKMVAWQLATRLARRGHEITFLVPAQKTITASSEEENNGVRIVRYPNDHHPAHFIRAGREACARLWTKQPFDLVHTHFAYASVGPFQVLPPSLPRVRSFYGFWDEEGWIQESRFVSNHTNRLVALAKRLVRARIERSNLRHSQAVVTLSEFSARQLREHGVPLDQIHISPPGVDSERFCLTNDTAAVRRHLGIPEGRRLLLSVRRLVPRMGLDRLLEAMPAVITQFPDVFLVIGGQGLERQRLQNQVSTLHLENHVRLVGFIPDDELPAYYQAADLFVLPTVALEGFGLVTLQAFACGTPVIGTPVGATPEVLNQIDASLLTRDATSEALAESICRFWKEDRRRVLTAKRLHEFAHHHFPWEAHVVQMEKLYDELCEHHGASAQSTRETHIAATDSPLC